ncbi:hypothetical protein ACFL3F_05115 [Planctomycetota bacterium]
MQNTTATAERTKTFICPYCSDSVFEIIGTQIDVDAETEEDAQVIVIRCLKCHDVYYHPVSNTSRSLL